MNVDIADAVDGNAVDGTLVVEVGLGIVEIHIPSPGGLAGQVTMILVRKIVTTCGGTKVIGFSI